MSGHLNHDELVLVYYGEAGAGEHLESCDICRTEYERLALLLDSVRSVPAPLRPGDYEGRVWAALEPKLGVSLAPIPFRHPAWKRVAIPASIAAMLVIAFQLGRYMPAEPDAPSVAVVETEEGAGRVLESALGRHLERSRRVLIEVVNSPDSPNWDISAERLVAEDLLENNRLYRQTAAQVGQSGLEETLEDLERILLEISHSPDTVPAETLESLRRRIESLELLFRVRVLESQIRGRREAAQLPESNL
jgi:hypothetical protein